MRSACPAISLGRPANPAPRKYLPMRFHVDQPACARDGRVIGRIFIQRMPRKRRRLSESFKRPGDAALRLNALEVPVIQRTEIDARRQPRTAQLIGIEPGALLLNESVEASRRIPRSDEHRRDGPDQQPYLRTPPTNPLAAPDSCAYHRHNSILRVIAVEIIAITPRRNQDFHHRLIA